MTDTAGNVIANELLATKLHAPRRRRELVHRPRLNDRLVRSHQPVLTLVSAPAGFGKTTLLTEWFGDVDDSRALTAWLALDEGDNDSAVFGSYLVAALQTVAPQVGITAVAVLRSARSLQSAVAVLINDLQTLSDDVVLILDDYDVIHSTDVHEAIAFLIEHAPPRFRLVLASRADPPLPLARLRARGDLLEVRAADLRFTDDEASTYLNERMGLQLAPRDVGALEVRTEGWIAALQLAALSLRGRDDVAGFIANFTGNDRFVVDYLAEEVLERQPRDVRDFLMHTAVLDRFTGSLCDAVTGRTGGKATLEMLDRANLFVVALDDRREWYRYHHLFADVLRARMLDEQPERLSELHRRASEWFDAHGDASEAIAHAMAGRDVERAAQLIEMATPMMRQTRQEATLRRWLEALPVELFEDRPVLSLALVGARMATGDSIGVETLVERAEQWLQTPHATPIVFDHYEFTRLPIQIEMYRAGVALLAGDTDGTIAHATRVLELAEPSDHLPRAAGAALLGLAHWSLGDLDKARIRYTESLECFVKANFIPDLMGVSLGLADIQIAQGRLRDARRTFESALKHASVYTALRGTADINVGLSELMLESNDLDEAARHLQISTELGEHAGLPQYAYRWRVAMARLRQAHGDLDGALELLSEAEAVYNTDFSPAIEPIAAMKARVQLSQGDVASARRWVASRKLAAGDDLNYVREYEHITLARTLLAESSDDTVAFVTRLLAAAEAGNRERRVVELLALLALALEANGDRHAAVLALEQALVRAVPDAYVRVFIDAGAALISLLRSVSLSDDAKRHAQRVISGANPTNAPPRRGGLVDELSARELDVLRLLRSELGGPEIARELHVSLNTVRTHTKNIYTKLGATNRREAIRRAAELGL